LTGFATARPAGVPIADAIFARGMNLSPRRPTYLGSDERCCTAIPALMSDHQQIDQRNQGGPDAGDDQGVVDGEVVARIERRVGCFIGHSGELGQAGLEFYDADHIQRVFFTAWSGTPG
jgi:hypothetical protein